MRISFIGILGLLTLAGTGCAVGYSANPPEPHFADAGPADASTPAPDAAPEPEPTPEPQPEPDPSNPKCTFRTVTELSDCVTKARTACKACVSATLAARTDCNATASDAEDIGKAICVF